MIEIHGNGVFPCNDLQKHSKPIMPQHIIQPQYWIHWHINHFVGGINDNNCYLLQCWLIIVVSVINFQNASFETIKIIEES